MKCFDSLKIYIYLTLTALIMTSSTYAQSQLSAEDRATMTAALEKLNQGWDQPSVNAANTIIVKGVYNEHHWRGFFEGYFSNHKLTWNAWTYFWYPSFGWFDDYTHYKLQYGCYEIAKARINTVFQNHPSDLGSFLNASVADRDELMAWLNFAWNLGARETSRMEKRLIFDWNKQLIMTYPQWLAGQRFIDPVAHPYANAVRTLIHVNLRDALELTPEVMTEIATTLQLSGDKLLLWNTYSLLIHDNQFLQSRDFTFIHNLWDAVPAPLILPGNITVNGALGNVGSTTFRFEARTMVNIFDIHAGSARENGFPSEVTPYDCDGFALVAIHEANHVVGGLAIERDPNLKARQATLIQDAGNDRMNYLRSVIEDGIFTRNPQEFFASISNMYFANTALTFEVGQKRLQAGRHQPLEQFLFFLDMYSVGSNVSRGFVVDTDARLIAYEIPLQRSAHNRITHFTLPSGSYEIIYNSNGKPSSVAQQNTGLLVTTSAADYKISHVAANSIVAAFGSNLATGAYLATSLPLPTSLGGTTVKIKDRAGNELFAPLFFASPSQVNYQVPPGAATGPALVTITSGNGQTLVGGVRIAAAAPTIFTVDQSGAGQAAAIDAYTYTSGPFAATGPNGGPNILAFFGTGLGADATDTDGNVKDNVKVMIGDQLATVMYAGRAPGFAGLNQLNVVLPLGINAGPHTVVIWRNNMASNKVTITIRGISRGR